MLFSVALGVALSVTSLTLGFHLGSKNPHGHSSSTPTLEEKEKLPDPTTLEEDEYEDEDEEMADGDLSAVQAGFMEQCKLV